MGGFGACGWNLAQGLQETTQRRGVSPAVLKGSFASHLHPLHFRPCTLRTRPTKGPVHSKQGQAYPPDGAVLKGEKEPIEINK